jgi:bifunctional ADP-heptose synthase (sugar kinase/adenylyltransferase)
MLGRKSFIAELNALRAQHDIEIIAALDYRKGFFKSKEACVNLTSYCRNNKIQLYVDSRGDLTKFKGANIIKVNQNEYVAASAALNCLTPLALCRELGSDKLIITRGAKGASLTCSQGLVDINIEPDLTKYTGTPDVTGAGDVFDINFCYNYGVKGLLAKEALDLAVQNATEFAYDSVKGRL